MVASLDGFIAKADNSISWLETSDVYEPGRTLSQAETETFLQSIDCYIMGANTYQQALALEKEYGWAYGEKPTIVLTRQNWRTDKANVHFYSGDIQALLNNHLKARYRNLWLVGGAKLLRAFMQLQLVDELRVTVLPVLLGGGLPFFDPMGQEQALHLVSVTPYKNGMVELHYQVKR